MSDIETHFGSFGDYMELLNEAAEMPLSKWERDFIDDLTEKADEYGEECYLSDGQARKLREILETYA
jgi:hypothetical protein